MKRRHLIVAGAAALAAPSIARAQAKYPDRTVRLVVPFPPAGPTDIIGRMVAEKMTGLLGQNMIVENKAGAAGSIGAVEVKNAKADGYTFLFAPSSTHAINPTAFVKPLYDPIKDFTPISSICVITSGGGAIPWAWPQRSGISSSRRRCGQPPPSFSRRSRR